MIGNGSTIVRAPGSPNFRILAVSTGGNLSLQRTTLSGGVSAGKGGAIYNALGSLTLTDSTVSGNSAAGNGGGISNFSATATATLSNSTVSGNTSGGSGGGISGTNGSTLTLIDSTVVGNSGVVVGGIQNNGAGSSLKLSRSLISGNTATSTVREIFSNNGATVTANNFNLFGNSGISSVMGFTPGTTDIVPAAALAAILGPLANNGGPTQTHALGADSPAVNVAGTGCSGTDQRGVNAIWVDWLPVPARALASSPQPARRAR